MKPELDAGRGAEGLMLRFVLAVILSGCARGGGDGRGASAAPASDDTCAEVAREAAAVLAGASGRCEHDGDCACLPRQLACAGVSDRRSVERLRTLARLQRLGRCRAATPRRCDDARVCTPRCVHRYCVNSAAASVRGRGQRLAASTRVREPGRALPAAVGFLPSAEARVFFIN
ncbi:MAG: hypothetical protein IPL40_02750 [Proteobacteria bacterium]|nr:hypothetical protein [Pseudomonadota bacterium]